jgi:hypothetical protein
MGLIDEIRDRAVSGKVPLEDVLRHCMVLAARLKHDPLKTWTHQELNGYQSSADVPDYRVVQATLRYRDVGPFHLRSDLVPSSRVPPESDGILRRIPLRPGVAELEAWQGGGGIKVAMPENLHDYLDAAGLESWGLTDVYREVSGSTLKGVLSTIRNRVLEFVLSLEDQSTEIDSAAPGSRPVPLKNVDDKFGIYIMGHGNVVTVAGQSAAVQLIKKQVVQNDVASLKAFLANQGVSEHELKQLDKVIETAQATDLDDQRSALHRWVNKAAKSMVGGGKSVLPAAAKEAVLLSIRYYFGEITGSGAGSPPSP